MAINSHGDERMESPQVSWRPLLMAALGALLLLAFAIGVLDAIYYWQVPVNSFPAPEKFPEPRVQTGQVQQLRRLEAQQTQRLTQYRWVDRTQGLIQIPIGRAMQLLAAEGAQAYAPLLPPQSLASPSAGPERLITPQASPPSTPAASSSQASPGAAKTPATPSPSAPSAPPAGGNGVNADGGGNASPPKAQGQ